MSKIGNTVEPRLSGMENCLKKRGGACQQLLPWTQECSSSAHAQTPTFTAVYQLSGWIKAWFILFDYSVIRHGSEQRCPDNRGSTVIVILANFDDAVM